MNEQEKKLYIQGFSDAYRLVSRVLAGHPRTQASHVLSLVALELGYEFGKLHDKTPDPGSGEQAHMPEDVDPNQQ